MGKQPRASEAQARLRPSPLGRAGPRLPPDGGEAEAARDQVSLPRIYVFAQAWPSSRSRGTESLNISGHPRNSAPGSSK